MSTLKSKPAHQSHKLRQEQLVANFNIVHHATPASKLQGVDIPGTMVLRLKGLTATADAVESGITWTTAVDVTNAVFGIVLDLGDNKADKVYSVTLTEVTSVEASHALSSPTGVTNYLTAAGNIAIQVTATGLDLETEDPTYTLAVVYREAR